MKYLNIKHSAAIFLTSTLLFTGCAQKNSEATPNSQNQYEKTTQGAVVGAFLGTLIGLMSGGSGKNVVLGGAIGAAVGGGIGYSMDEQAKQIAQELNTQVDNTPEAAVNPDKDLIISNTDKYVKIMLRDSMVFDTNSAIPTQEAARKLEKITKVLRKYPDTIVQVVGFTDSRGSYEYNQKLSEKRASNVGNTIYNSGIENQVYSKGCSYNKPLVANKTKDDMALNRRVEIYLYSNQNSVIDACNNEQ